MNEDDKKSRVTQRLLSAGPWARVPVTLAYGWLCMRASDTPDPEDSHTFCNLLDVGRGCIGGQR